MSDPDDRDDDGCTVDGDTLAIGDVATDRDFDVEGVDGNGHLRTPYVRSLAVETAVAAGTSARVNAVEDAAVPVVLSVDDGDAEATVLVALGPQQAIDLGREIAARGVAARDRVLGR